ncbi:MAG: LptE family protein [Verrucomicrobia bacterium]|nr:LptE family protein [Cytophagales bacterium]
MILCFLLADCRKVNYSFSGINIGDAKTIYIANVYNNVGGGPSNLSQIFTENLKDYYQKNTPLKIVNGEADLLLEATITGYTFLPTATGVEQAQQNRLSINVQVSFTNTLDEEQNIKNQSFSFFRDFPAAQSLSQVESGGGLTPVIDQIVFDIFNKSVANW